jgi:hypothetical protein
MEPQPDNLQQLSAQKITQINNGQTIVSAERMVIPPGFT